MNRFHKNNIRINFSRVIAILFIVIGIFAIFICGGTFLTGILTTSDFNNDIISVLIVLALLIAGGVMLTKYGFGTLFLIRNILFYEKFIPADKAIEITELAGLYNKSCTYIRKQLDRMIKRKYVCGTFTDGGAAIILNGAEGASNVQSEPSIPFRLTASLTCPGCGAMNKIAQGLPNICEYCGRSLNK